jgi:hypothetical protein
MADDSLWLFSFHPDDRWEISRNGREVSVGPGDRASVAAGVDQFLSLTRRSAGSDGACSVTVGALLDQLESAQPRNAACGHKPRFASAGRALFAIGS